MGTIAKCRLKVSSVVQPYPHGALKPLGKKWPCRDSNGSNSRQKENQYPANETWGFKINARATVGSVGFWFTTRPPLFFVFAT